MAILALYDEAVQGEHGGAHNPHGLGGKSGKTAADIDNFDNIQVDKEKPENIEAAPTGTSAQAGMRRLQKAAEDDLALNAPAADSGLRPAQDR